MTDIKTDLPIELPVSLPDPRPSDPIEALSWLGDTEEEVVKSLRERGIKGRRGDPESCPLHNYLLVFGWHVGVSGMSINPGSARGEWEPITVGYQFASFVGSFDCGAYPDLIDNG